MNKSQTNRLLGSPADARLLILNANLLVGQYMAEHIPSAEFKMVDGSAHMLYGRDLLRRAV